MRFFSSTEARKKAIIALVIFIFLIVAAIVFVWPYLSIFTKPSVIKEVVLSYGIWAPLAFIGLQILQMVFLFIPSTPIIIVGGYVFGALGILYSIIGIVLGSVIIFYIGRLFGRPFLESILDKKIINKIDGESDNIAKTLFILFLIPPLPHDAICYLTGFTKIKLKKYILVTIIGRLPLIVFLTLIGYQLTKLNLFWSLIIIGIIIVGSIIIFQNKNKIETQLHGYVGKLEKK
ncbi:MAG TPA: TVP38/TMEM64 family protein [Candidatus Diapherotrites archaeon]|nr:TVP38/TMEM64 family protein [Candidatus Diapherotrites archaeon]